MSDDSLTPRPEHRFTFGLWTVGNPGRDPFGAPTRDAVDPVDSVRRLAELGAWGVSLHDEDLVPYGVSASERDRNVARFKAALEETGLGVGMATSNLFGHPVFKDGFHLRQSSAHSFERRFVDQRPDQRALLARIADLHARKQLP